MERIWITGARGFIGRHLAAHLAAEGLAVSGIGHGLWPDTEAERWGLRYWVNGELNAGNFESLRRLSGEPDAIIHLAGGSSVAASLQNPFEDFSRTVGGTAQLLDWLRDAAPRAKLVVVSSAAVYGSQFDHPVPPGAPTRPYSPYGHHKLMMEQLCRSYGESYGLRCTVVRLFSVYGPYLRKQLLWDLCTRLARGESPILLGGTGKELRDWTEVSDVVRLLKCVLQLPDGPGAIVDGGSGIGTSVAAIADIVAKAWRCSTEIRFSGVGRPGDPFSLVADPALLAESGFRWQVSPDEGISSYVEWFKAVGK